jgi:hypothetical protein
MFYRSLAETAEDFYMSESGSANNTPGADMFEAGKLSNFIPEFPD